MKTSTNLPGPKSGSHWTMPQLLPVKGTVAPPEDGHWTGMPGIDVSAVSAPSDLLHLAACSDCGGSSSGAVGVAICRAAWVKITGCLSMYEAYVWPGPQSFHGRRN